MSWFRVDDTWADSAKVDIISDVAARLWTICGTWCSKKENLKFDGKISRAALATITKRRWSDDVLEAAIIELVETSKVGGLYEHGLWEPTEGGWRFHDWERYKPRDCDEPELSPQESGRIGGLRSAEARREKFGTAVPNNARNRRVTEVSPKCFGKGPLEGPSKKTHRRVTEATEAPDPDPDPDPRSDPEVGSQDLTGYPREDASLPPPAPNLGSGQESTDHPIAAAPRGLSQAFDPSHEQPKPRDPKRAPEGNLARVPDPDAQDPEPEPEPHPPVSAKIPTCAKRFATSFDTEAPDEIEFTEEHRVFAKQNGIELAETWLACRDYRRSKRYRSCDWQAEFLSWLRREAKYRREKVSKNGPSKAPRQPSAQGGFSAAFLRAANGTDGK